MQEFADFYSDLLKQDEENVSSIKSQGGATYATPNYASLSLLMLRLATLRTNKCVFIDFGSGTGNVLFLAERMLAGMCDRFVGIEFNPVVNIEAERRRVALRSSCIFEQKDILSLDVNWLLAQSGEEERRHVILFSFDCRMPEQVVNHIAKLYKSYNGPSITLISTWSPHFFKMMGNKFGVGLVIGLSPYSIDADNMENFPEDQYEEVEERKGLIELKIMKEMARKKIDFEPSMLSERFTMYVYEKSDIGVNIGCNLRCRAAFCSQTCAHRIK